MKRILILVNITTLLVVLSFSSCSKNDNSSFESSREYFDQFINQIKEISNDYGYSLTEEFTPVTSGERTITLNINDNEYIDINFNNLSFKSGKSKKKTFCVDYRIIDQNKKMDMDLFLKICNTISQKELDSNTCSEFLKSDRYNVEESNSDIVSKEKYFDFWQNWGLFYNENYLGLATSSFSFCGYTK